MNTETTLRDEDNSFQPHLYMAFELSQSKWKLGFTIGFGQKPRIRTIKARDLAALQVEIKAVPVEPLPSAYTPTPVSLSALPYTPLPLPSHSLAKGEVKMPDNFL